MLETCDACGRPARGLVLSKASGEMVAAPRWEPYWTCEKLHRAAEMAEQIARYDPGAKVLSLVCYPDTDRESAPAVIEPGDYGMEP
jgi:hypothetical protein